MLPGEMEKLTSILNDGEMEELLRAIVEVTYEPGAKIIQQGERKQREKGRSHTHT